MFGSLFSRKPDPSSIDLETFAKAVRAGDVTVVDVRETNEFAAGKAPLAGGNSVGQVRSEQVLVTGGVRGGGGRDAGKGNAGQGCDGKVKRGWDHCREHGRAPGKLKSIGVLPNPAWVVPGSAAHFTKLIALKPASSIVPSAIEETPV